ncbi:hypothetical protein QMA06_08825 [Winogradskyella sp. APC 3343]|uniref:Lmo0937 family membrane protein n=1 Tax=Winogradskyella bathintestinalis TaxID=3035208 RepID=A0ABT7ZV27_9FLAO|nr:hypothetical protein [Winogradskyella bathintestinalis]
MKTFLYIFLVLLIILWALGYFVFLISSVIHLLLLVVIAVIIVINWKK